MNQNLVDNYGRPINSLRISLTQRCNFNCFFCHQEGEHSPGEELTADEIEAAVSVAAELGITKVKLTGGEPLLREDVVEIVRRIAPYVEEVSMTTNASLLDEKAYSLKEAGLRRVNVSLHTLNPDGFKEITGCSDEDLVRKGVEAALRCGLHPVKLNMVVMKGVNSDEIPEMIRFSRETGTVLQLIEFQELENGAEYYEKYHYDLKPVEDKLEKEAVRVAERELHRRRVYHLVDGAQAEVVRPMHNSRFCAYCTRLRLTSDGRLKPCLMRDDNLVPFVELVRAGEPRDRLVEAFREAVARREPYWRD
ncbi:MAG TPA: GTP 3',8-cyclase MoaA [Candidatus Krumholzibacteriaceae bacterium]|nr:GTP 3',8-cyclase MoaA [Candidatus Krumholzibacteriaceae bacterium]